MDSFTNFKPFRLLICILYYMYFLLNHYICVSIQGNPEAQELIDHMDRTMRYMRPVTCSKTVVRTVNVTQYLD
jgi:hypothetical protein